MGCSKHWNNFIIQGLFKSTYVWYVPQRVAKRSVSCASFFLPLPAASRGCSGVASGGGRAHGANQKKLLMSAPATAPRHWIYHRIEIATQWAVSMSKRQTASRAMKRRTGPACTGTETGWEWLHLTRLGLRRLGRFAAPAHRDPTLVQD